MAIAWHCFVWWLTLGLTGIGLVSLFVGIGLVAVFLICVVLWPLGWLLGLLPWQREINDLSQSTDEP